MDRQALYKNAGKMLKFFNKKRPEENNQRVARRDEILFSKRRITDSTEKPVELPKPKHTPVQRLTLLQRWREERRAKKERDAQQKLPPFLAGKAAPSPNVKSATPSSFSRINMSGSSTVNSTHSMLLRPNRGIARTLSFSTPNVKCGQKPVACSTPAVVGKTPLAGKNGANFKTPANNKMAPSEMRLPSTIKRVGSVTSRSTTKPVYSTPDHFNHANLTKSFNFNNSRNSSKKVTTSSVYTASKRTTPLKENSINAGSAVKTNVFKKPALPEIKKPSNTTVPRKSFAPQDFKFTGVDLQPPAICIEDRIADRKTLTTEECMEILGLHTRPRRSSRLSFSSLV